MSKTDKTMLDDAALEAFFVAGRAHAPEPGTALMARIMADADAEIAARAAPKTRPGRARPGLWAAVVAAIGGWPAVASMATAAVTGVWLGFAAPEALNTFAGGLLPSTSTSSETAYELEDLLPGYNGFADLAGEVQG
ncbi:MAG: hypothetical protein KDK11_10515 [Maritimibacter sp.]|nr:hypothetical protein [Maritimibacter sp.]